MRDLESSIAKAADALLAGYADDLSERDLKCPGPQIVIWQPKPDRHTSELRLTFLKGGQIDDVLEFHIYREGEPVVTFEQARDWLDEQIKGIARGARDNPEP